MHGELMRAEIEQQPDALRDALPGYRAAFDFLANQRFEVTVLAARGSSDHAALYARYLIEVHLGIPAILAAPSVLTRYKRRVRYPKCLAVGISQSGAAPDVAEVLEAARDDGHTTLAITNTPGSRLTKAADHVLDLGVGPERSVAATKTYSASLLALYEMVRALGADLPEPLLPGAAWLAVAGSRAEEDCAHIMGATPVFALGRGYNFSTAQETALKLMECALLPCKAYSTADFEHGPKALAAPGSAILLFGSGGGGLAKQGAAVITAPQPDVPEEIAPLWQIIYGQYLALHCALARGEDPDEPQFITKVTKTL